MKILLVFTPRPVQALPLSRLATSRFNTFASLALFISPLVLSDIWRRCKVTLASDSLTKYIEDHWHRYKYERHAAKQCTGPLDSHTVEHEGCEQWEDSTKHGPHEGVCCNSGSGKHEVRVDDVIEKREEDREDSEAGKETAQNRDDPMHIAGVACPSEPEETGCEEHTTDHADG